MNLVYNIIFKKTLLNTLDDKYTTGHRMTPERVWCLTNSNKLVILNTIEALIIHLLLSSFSFQKSVYHFVI